MKNKLGYFGFLGLLGLVGFFAHNYIYFTLFAFLYYLRYFLVIPDELFKENVRKAASPAFFISVVIYILTLAVTAFRVSRLIFVIGLVSGFVLPIILFTLLLVVFELNESWSKR